MTQAKEICLSGLSKDEPSQFLLPAGLETEPIGTLDN